MLNLTSLASFPQPALTHIRKRGQQIARTIEINGTLYELPIVVLPDSKRVRYSPDDLVFTVYQYRDNQWFSLGATGKLEPAQRLMKKAGHALTVSVTYRPCLPDRGIEFRFRVGLLNKRGAKDLRIQYMGHSYPAEESQC